MQSRKTPVQSQVAKRLVALSLYEQLAAIAVVSPGKLCTLTAPETGCDSAMFDRYATVRDAGGRGARTSTDTDRTRVARHGETRSRRAVLRSGGDIVRGRCRTVVTRHVEYSTEYILCAELVLCACSQLVGPVCSVHSWRLVLCLNHRAVTHRLRLACAGVRILWFSRVTTDEDARRLGRATGIQRSLSAREHQDGPPYSRLVFSRIRRMWTLDISGEGHGDPAAAICSGTNREPVLGTD